jgi:hypothetical protein
VVARFASSSFWFFVGAGLDPATTERPAPISESLGSAGARTFALRGVRRFPSERLNPCRNLNGLLAFGRLRDCRRAMQMRGRSQCANGIRECCGEPGARRGTVVGEGASSTIYTS